MDQIKSPNLLNHILETIFLYLDVPSLINCSLVCKNWYVLLVDENRYIWKLNCNRYISYEALESDVLSSLRTHKEKVRAFFHTWNPKDCSENCSIEDDFTFVRNPVAQTTDACRGKIGFTRGKHIWEINWTGPLGTVAVIGIATKDAPLTAKGYFGLLGSNEHSWGWNLIDDNLVHNGYVYGKYPYWDKNKQEIKGLNQNIPAKYRTGETYRVILDCDDKTLSFERNNEWLGPAFSGLPAKCFYPSVSAVFGNSEVSLVYIGSQLDDDTIV
ncbi:hypothetical protein HCN44_009114 [Aphidius gifuensis]|uniref:F-box/SPRY domain-containing protein 1 n=1 Tax=Aphidius gifuensis TaxID=684658 RepID=A0A834Y449_APHGI|nr:F-box/SPRY domain-containing protein 1 [Aphidius gifuensis]KAF7997716.1 hypothetical protein HCN44_009114 [Aphidius gifuensis]